MTDNEKVIGDALQAGFAMLHTVAKISPSWRKKVGKELTVFSEAFNSETEGESEGEGESKRTESQAKTEQRVRAAVNEELVPSLRRRWGIASK